MKCVVAIQRLSNSFGISREDAGAIILHFRLRNTFSHHIPLENLLVSREQLKRNAEALRTSLLLPKDIHQITMATFTRTLGDLAAAVLTDPIFWAYILTPVWTIGETQNSKEAGRAAEAPDPALEALAAETKRLAILDLQMENDTQSPLLRLPPELRNEIGALILLRSEELPLTEIFEATSLLRVCSRLRRDLRPMFFAENTFSLNYNASASRTEPLERSIEAFGRKCLEAFSASEHVRTIQIRLQADDGWVWGSRWSYSSLKELAQGNPNPKKSPEAPLVWSRVRTNGTREHAASSISRA